MSIVEVAQTPEFDELSQEHRDALSDAADNFIHALGLNKVNNILFITDKSDPNNYDATLRRALVRTIDAKLNVINNHTRNTHSVVWEFDDQMSYEDIARQTSYGIVGALNTDTDHTPLTVVYIGDRWANRWGMYDALGFASRFRDVNIAIAPAATPDDILVMSKISPDLLHKMGKGIDYYEKFFNKHPDGELIIRTKHGDLTGALKLSYDTKVSPVAHDRGFLDRLKPTPVSSDYGEITNGGNLLGVESYLAPMSFKNANGTFLSKEGILFTVEKGYVVRVAHYEAVFDQLEEKQQQAIKIIAKGGKLGLSEFGAGGNAFAGIVDLPKKCSSLMWEKASIHFGLGKTAGKSAEEAELSAATDKYGFGHIDFVTPANTTVAWLKDTETEQFYPPKGGFKAKRIHLTKKQPQSKKK